MLRKIKKLVDWRAIYLVYTTAKRGRVKIGITGWLWLRSEQIDESIKGSKERPFFWGYTLASEFLEKKVLHSRFRKRRKPWKGSGRTEWFDLGILGTIEAIFWITIFSFLSWAILILFSAFVFIQLFEIL